MTLAAVSNIATERSGDSLWRVDPGGARADFNRPDHINVYYLVQCCDEPLGGRPDMH